jgi:hypothetical protein
MTLWRDATRHTPLAATTPEGTQPKEGTLMAATASLQAPRALSAQRDGTQPALALGQRLQRHRVCITTSDEDRMAFTSVGREAKLPFHQWGGTLTLPQRRTEP